MENYFKKTLDRLVGLFYTLIMRTETIQRGTAKEKIIEVASDLFYRQGYNATGIQQIIDEEFWLPHYYKYKRVE